MNKYLLSVLLLILLFSSCNKKEEQPQEKNSNDRIEKQTPVVKEEPKNQPPPIESKDITKEIKKIFKVNDTYKVIVEDAKLNRCGKIYVKVYFDKESLSLAHLVMSNHSNMSQIIAYFTFNAVFKTIKLIFKKFPDAREVNYTFLDIEEKRDRYGNKTNEGRKPLYDIKLRDDTTNEINFNYVKELLSKVYMGGDYKELSQMLDGFYSYPN